MIVLYFVFLCRCTKTRKCFRMISSLLVDNRLSVRLGKTDVILFGPPRKLKKKRSLTVLCIDHNIKGTQRAKYLDMCIDTFFSSENVVFSIIQKVNTRLKVVVFFSRKYPSFLNLQWQRVLCSALIQCFITLLRIVVSASNINYRPMLDKVVVIKVINE